MFNCIFTPYCMESFCDKSCPRLVETSYLLDRNDINIGSHVFSEKSEIYRILEDSFSDITSGLGVLVTNDTVRYSNILTYLNICKFWRGSRLHCDVYNLRYSKYIDSLKSTWNGSSESEELQYMKIWSNSAKVLIISNFDYVKFGDFESQTMLNLLQSRQSDGKVTILVSPPITSLVSTNSKFFDVLKSKMKDSVKVVMNR